MKATIGGRWRQMLSLGRLIALCSLVWAGLPVNSFAQALSETAVRAAFVFNFGKFVEWPAGKLERSERFAICFAGSIDPLYRELAKLQDKTVQTRPIDVPRITSATEVSQCMILVMGEGEARQARRELLRAAEAAHVLTVGDAEGFAAAGGAIGLVNSGDRVIFEINLEAARAANLRIPAQLAKLGKVVTSPK